MQETWAVTGVYPDMDWTAGQQRGRLLGRRQDPAGRRRRRQRRRHPFPRHRRPRRRQSPHPQVVVAPDQLQHEDGPLRAGVARRTAGRFRNRSAICGSSRRRAATPRRLTQRPARFEAYPAWSRDGRAIAFVGWTDARLGRVKTVGAGGGARRRHQPSPAIMRARASRPTAAPSCSKRGSGGYLTSPDGADEPGVYRVPASGGTPKRVTKRHRPAVRRHQRPPVHDAQTDEGKRQLICTDLGGEAQPRPRRRASWRRFRRSRPTAGRSPSARITRPIVMPLMPGAQDVAVDAQGRRPAGDAGQRRRRRLPPLVDGGAQLHWSMGPTLFTADTRSPSSRRLQAEDAPKFVARHGISLAMDVAAKPIAARSRLPARASSPWRGADGGIIEDGVVADRRRPHRRRRPARRRHLPAGTPTIDVTGKTIMPGLHRRPCARPAGRGRPGPAAELVDPRQPRAWARRRSTIRRTGRAKIFAASEMQRAGLILGAAHLLDRQDPLRRQGGRRFTPRSTARRRARPRPPAEGAGRGSVKNYNQPRREQRQLVVAAARARTCRSWPKAARCSTWT